MIWNNNLETENQHWLDGFPPLCWFWSSLSCPRDYYCISWTFKTMNNFYNVIYRQCLHTSWHCRPLNASTVLSCGFFFSILIALQFFANINKVIGGIQLGTKIYLGASTSIKILFIGISFLFFFCVRFFNDFESSGSGPTVWSPYRRSSTCWTNSSIPTGFEPANYESFSKN